MTTTPADQPGDYGMSLLQKITERFARRGQTRAENFVALARQIADGQRVDADAAAEVLAQAGKSPEDLAAAVELVLQRRAWRRDLESAAGLAGQRDAIARARAVAERELAAAQQRYRAAVEPLAEKESAIDAAEAAARSAEQNLVQTCTDPATRAALDELTAKRDQLQARQREVAGIVQRDRDQIARIDERLARGSERSSTDPFGVLKTTRPLTPEEAASDKEAKEFVTARLAENEKALTELNRQLAAVLVQIAAARTRLLEA